VAIPPERRIDLVRCRPGDRYNYVCKKPEFFVDIVEAATEKDASAVLGGTPVYIEF
jgi:hypothetical protein